MKLKDQRDGPVAKPDMDGLSSDPEPALWKETTFFTEYLKLCSAHYPQAHTYELDEMLFLKKKLQTFENLSIINLFWTEWQRSTI